MLNSKNERELAYFVKIDAIEPIIGSDNCECAVVGGWRVMVRKETFKAGDLAIYFEVDSKVDTTKREFAFLAKRNGKIKTQKYTFGGKGLMYSQGLLMHTNDFIDETGRIPAWLGARNVIMATGGDIFTGDTRFLTKELGVVYADNEDNTRKASTPDKYKVMAQRNPNLFKNKLIKKIMRYKFGRQVMFFLFGKKKKAKDTAFPTGKFPGVSITDQERCENLSWVLEDKTPFIITQKCDGSSGTFILERKRKHKYEFYVCSRRVRMLKPDQQCFYGDKNYYWEVAQKYDIENKMKDYLEKNPDISFVCWQGEICAPGIQKNPHHLKETHFYAFHFTDSKNGRYDIREAEKIWKSYGIEVVPIVNNNYIMPDDFEEFKLTADGKYDPSVCEGDANCRREGFVYYKTTDPTFSFKNVSREYLLNH